MLRDFVISCFVVACVLPGAARTRPHYGGVLRVEAEGDAWGQHSELARRLVFDGLTNIDADGTVRPSLAVRWVSENSDHRWQFWLRPGVHFQDGAPLTAATVEAALTGVCGTACPWNAVHAVGQEVIFTSNAPLPNLPSVLAGDDFLIVRSGTLSASIQAVGGSGTVNSAATSLPGPFIGTGPFELIEFTNGVLRLGANESCWQGRPFVDKVEIYGHKAIRDQWLDLEVGRADLVEVPSEQLRQARERRLTVVASPPISLLALALADGGTLANSNLRGAIAQAVDRNALSNVIFQKQGEVAAGLLPSRLTGYGFLFPSDRDLNKAHELRGGLNIAPLVLSAEHDPVMQLAAQRIALNLREAGFNVQVAGSGGVQRADLVLLRLTLRSSQPRAALELLLRSVGAAAVVSEDSPSGLFRVESDFLSTHTLIPLLYLPRAYAASGRVRDLLLSPAGVPLLAGASLEDTP